MVEQGYSAQCYNLPSVDEVEHRIQTTWDLHDRPPNRFARWLLTRGQARWIKAAYEPAPVPQLYAASVRHTARRGDCLIVIDRSDSFCTVDPTFTTKPVHSISSLSLIAELRTSGHGGAPRIGGRGCPLAA